MRWWDGQGPFLARWISPFLLGAACGVMLHTFIFISMPLEPTLGLPFQIAPPHICSSGGNAAPSWPPSSITGLSYHESAAAIPTPKPLSIQPESWNKDTVRTLLARKVPLSVQKEVARVVDALNSVGRTKLASMFSHCFVNTLETTTLMMSNGHTHVFTGKLPLGGGS